MIPSLASLEERRAARQYENYRLYARSAALCFELDQLAAARPDEVLRTISIEGAGALSSPSGAERYDWANKCCFQLTRRELPLFVGTLMGWIPEFAARGHGPDHSKSLTISQQPGGLKLMLSQKGKQLVVPVTADDVYMVLDLAINALVLNDPHLTSDSALSLCRRIASLKG